MKNRKPHILFLSQLIWNFFSIFISFFKRPEEIAIKNYLFFSLFFTATFSFSQQYTNFNTKNGLPSNHVYRITQDYQGFIWFITDKGMTKYNGSTFTTFTTKEGLPSNDIWDIRIGHDNKVWFFTKANKIGYIQNNTVFTFESNKKNEILFPRIINQNKNEISFSSFKKHFSLKNAVWESTKIDDSKSFMVVNHKKLTHLSVNSKKDYLLVFNKKKQLKKIKIDQFFTKNKYYGQLNDSLYCWVNREKVYLLNFNTFQLKKTFYKSDYKEFVRFSAVHNNIQFSGEGFVAFLDTNYQLKNTIDIPEKLNSHFSFIDKNKNLWIATGTNGVYFLSYEKQKATYSLPNEKVGKLQKVHTDIIASVYKKGFYRYDTIQHTFNPFFKIDDYIFSASYIKELQSSYYLSDKNVFVIKNQKKSTQNNFYVARNLVYYNDFLYGNSSSGINKIDPKTYIILRDYLQNGIRDIKLFEGKVFLATASGIKQFSNDSITPVFLGKNTFNKPIISLTKLTKNQLIVCTDGFGAYRTDLNSIELLEQSEFLNVQAAFVENNHIWLATNKGVWQYQKEGDAIKLIRKYTINDGLSSNLINSVFITDNTILASSNDGISSIPIAKEENNQFISIYFDAVQYNNKSIINNPIPYSADNQLQVKIATIDFSKTTNQRYDYQLLPVQKNWIPTTSNQISFTDLSPNKYNLHIKSNGKTNTVEFEILPLWYQTNIFKIAIFLFILALLYFFNKWSQKRIENREKKKVALQQKRIDQELYALRSQMNPHFVFNSLSAIQYYINDNDFETSEEYLIKFSQLIRRFFELSKEEDITLKEEILLLKNYLEIEKLRFKEKLSFTIHIDDSFIISDVKIPTMLLQPIVENAVNHGIFNKIDNGLITINFSRKRKDSYEVEIIDNGVGIANTKPNLMKRKNSSMVLKNKLHYLNEHQNWKITYTTQELHPTKKDKGNISKFTITRL